MSNKTSCGRFLAGILEEIKNLCDGPERIQDLADKKFSLPTFLNLGDGDRITITREIEQSIGNFAKALMNERYPSPVLSGLVIE